MMYPCCHHCWRAGQPHQHQDQCIVGCPGSIPAQPGYVEATDANPERVNNGCMIFRQGQR